MSGKYIAGIDIGTTGAKTAIFDVDGNIRASGYREYTCSYPRAGWVDQDPDLLVKSAMDSAKEALSVSSVNPSDVGAVSVSAQRSCTIFVGKEGRPVRPMISWQDARTTAELDDITKVLSASEFYKITGLPHGATWILSKILWLRKNEPDAWKRVARIVQLHDFALKELWVFYYYEVITIDI